MHRLPGHENQHDPCNLYCRGDMHCDVIYIEPWVLARAPASLLAYVHEAWARLGYDASSEVLSIVEAPEAKDRRAHYPRGYRARPGVAQAYRVIYRVLPGTR
jgi:hypothetical protein